MIQIIRWALIFGFFLQILSVLYGVFVLSRIKREQKMLSDVLHTFSDRSAQIAVAIQSLSNSRKE